MTNPFFRGLIIGISLSAPFWLLAIAEFAEKWLVVAILCIFVAILLMIFHEYDAPDLEDDE